MKNKKSKSENEVDPSDDSEMAYEDMVIDGIPLKDIEKIDKLGRGMYKIYMKDDSSQEKSLDDGESSIIDHYISRHLSDDGLASDGPPSAEGINVPIFNREALERSQGNWMEVEPAHPDIRFYWPTKDTVQRYIQYGYVYAEPSMVKFFDSTLRDRIPGEGFSTSGRIEINGHILVACHKKTAEELSRKWYKERQRILPSKKEVVKFK